VISRTGIDDEIRERFAHAGDKLAEEVANLLAGSTIFAGTLSAMHDERTISKPDEFRIDRPWSEYMLFGHGLHTCYGQQIVRNQLPAMMTALLEGPPIQRARGRAGDLKWEGECPARMARGRLPARPVRHRVARPVWSASG